MLRKNTFFSALMIAALSLGAAGTVSAQDFFGFSFAKGPRGGKAVNVSFGNGFRGRRLARRCGPRHCHTNACRTWIAPRCETIRERYWVRGCRERVWVEPIYRTTYDRCGRARRVCVRRGFHRWVNRGGHWDYRDRVVNHPGRWAYNCGY